MSFHFTKKNYSKYYLALFVVFGIIFNVIISSITTALGLPLYLDTIGTIFVSLLGGALPGIVTGLFTNVIVNYYVEGYIYFSIINVVIALLASGFNRYSHSSKIVRFSLFIIYSALVCAFLGMGIQLLIPGLPMLSNLTELSKMFSGGDGENFLVLVIVSFFLNVADKGISLFLAVGLYRIMPAGLKKSIANYGWKQTPLSVDEINEYRKKAGGHTLIKKVTILLSAIIIGLTFILVSISISFYYEDCKDEYTAEATDTVKSASLMINGDDISEFVKWGEKAPRYEETAELLKVLLYNTQGVERLSIIIIENNGYMYLFEEAKPEVEFFETGILMPYLEEFSPYIDRLKNGEALNELIENEDKSILTSVYPIKDSSRQTVCYVMADVYMSFLTDYARDYLIKTFLCFAGFIVLILILGFTLAGYDLVFPINSLTTAAGLFLDSHGEQKILDDNVKKSRALGVKTDDEIEELYTAICSMESEMAEYVRDIKHYSDATKKMQNGLIITLASIVENRDSDSNYHVQNTASYVKIILNGLKAKGYYAEKISDEYIEELEMSAPLHDIGKIHISDSIINKHGELTPEEKEILRNHTLYGKEIIERAIDTVKGDTYLKEARNMAAYHHERWDGKGYPEGLHGEVIPLSARIMALANNLDALTSFKRFKVTYSLEDAIEIIKADSGKKYDPKCVEALLISLNEVKAVLNNGEHLGR